jgi:pilus assembly protein Flp/PilA
MRHPVEQARIMWRSPLGAPRETGGHQVGGARFDPQFLPKLAHQRRFGRLTLFDLAAGKLPQARHRPPLRALLQQDPPVRRDQSRGDHVQCRNFFHGRAVRLQSLKHDHLFSRGNGNSAVRPGDGMRHLQDLVKDKRGATAVEYGLILALVFLAMITAVQGFGSKTIGMWSNVSNAVTKR